MNLLQVFFIISGFIIFILAYDISQRQKFNALHFLVFLLVGIGLLVFTLFPETLNMLGRIFWLQRWADVLVYASIVFLLYFSLLLLTKNERNREDITRLVREISLLETRFTMYTKSYPEEWKENWNIKVVQSHNKQWEGKTTKNNLPI